MNDCSFGHPRLAPAAHSRCLSDSIVLKQFQSTAVALENLDGIESRESKWLINPKI
jgi:hypothetical protein